MSEEEKYALRCLEWDMLDSEQIEMILNLIERQQKEIENLERLIKAHCLEDNEFIVELREQLEKCEQELIEAKDEVLNLGEFLYESEKENQRLREIISSYESGEMIGGAKYE